MLKYAFPVLIVGLSGMVNEVFDKILLKYLVPEDAGPMAQLGIYGANYKLGILMTLFIQMFRYAAEPFFFAEAEKKNAPELFAKVMNYFVIAGLLIFLIVSLYIDLFKYFIGEKYRVGVVIVPIILMANLFYGIYFNLSIWYKLTDRTADGAKISIGGAIITIVLNIILIPILGYIGAAWATFFCFFAMMLASYIWGQKVYPIPYQLKRLLLYFLIAIVIFFSVRYVAEYHRIISYFASTILLALFAFFAFNREKTNTIEN
ncbi:MAG: polysaccharide biosynthesis C-terminal domain-containing protein [Ignavibacteria bacterium]|nr:polysaccharide biosynthesis C-terminal domain-containing protein [Ignavibacteria bacterium]